MRFLKYIMIWLCVLMVLASVAGYVYVRINGRQLFERQMEKFFGQEVTIESVRYLVPAGVRFHKLTVRNVLEAEDVFLHLRVPFLLQRKFMIASLELVRPVFQLVRPEKQQIDFGGTYLKQQEERFQNDASPEAAIRGVLIDFIKITGARVDILDLAVDEPVKYSADQISGKAMKISYPLEDQSIKLDLRGRILGAGKEAWLNKSAFVIAGWVNWPGRAMDLAVDLKTPGGVSVEARADGDNGQVQMTGRVEVGPADSEGEKPADAALPPGLLPDVVLGALQNSGSRMGMNFLSQTRMDDIHLELINFEGEVEPPRDKSGLEVLNPAVLFGADWPSVEKK